MLVLVRNQAAAVFAQVAILAEIAKVAFLCTGVRVRLRLGIIQLYGLHDAGRIRRNRRTGDLVKRDLLRAAIRNNRIAVLIQLDEQILL